MYITDLNPTIGTEIRGVSSVVDAVVTAAEREACVKLPKEETVTVDELIQLLAKYPPGLRVVVNGYENGYDDLTPEQLPVVRIALNTGKHPWDGQHGDANRRLGHAGPKRRRGRREAGQRRADD